jgi:hypothetical protein
MPQPRLQPSGLPYQLILKEHDAHVHAAASSVR